MFYYKNRYLYSQFFQKIKKPCANSGLHFFFVKFKDFRMTTEAAVEISLYIELTGIINQNLISTGK